MKNKKGKRKIKGFTLVELLVVITIVGILLGVGIYNFTKIINKSKGESYESNVNSLKVVSESYLQSNKELAPKNIGEYVQIKVSDLKAANYITEDIYNSNGESCMTNSYVKVYKITQNEFIYTPFIYCGDEEVITTTTDILPDIKISFSQYNGVANPYFVYNIKGNKVDHDIKVEGFTYTIQAKVRDTDEVFQEVFRSGTVSGKGNTTITGKVFLRDHIDITYYTNIKVSITAINELGGTATIEGVPGNEYHDDVAPVCLKTDNEATGFNDWVGKYTEPPTRTISEYCNDGENVGSGCIRTTFAKTWPNDDKVDERKIYKYGAEWADIVISDNALNSRACRVRVNVDVASPTVNLIAKGNGKTLKTMTLGGYDDNTLNENPFVGTIRANDYDSSINPPKNDGKVWFNHEYKDGVSYEISVTDNFYLDRWEWKVNKPGIPTTATEAMVVEDISVENDDGGAGSFNPVEGQIDSKAKKITIKFVEDGMRYGELWIYDKAGNYTKISMFANLDKVAPDIPQDISTFKLKSNNRDAANDVVYEKATWSMMFVRAEIDNKYKKDTISGYEKVQYRTYPHKSDTVKETGEGRDGNFVFHDGYQGKNKIDFDMCDFAGNCSKYSEKAHIWIDTIDPVCKNTITYNGTLSSAQKGRWLGIGETATVTGNCTDPGSPEEKGSGCTGPIVKHTYNYEIKTTVAGPDGNNRGGIYYDVAGNHTTCPTDQTVKIDYTLPKCYNTKTTSSPETSYGWLGIGKTATVSAHCTDVDSSVTNSGCFTVDFSYKYNFEIDTTKAGAKGDNKGGSVSDNADNEVNCPADQRVQIDYTAPSCQLKKTLNGTESAWGWLGIGETATISPKCTDNNGKQNANVKSGCDAAANNYSYTYNFQINTTRAGARGDGNGGVAYDKAGNAVNCKADQRVQIDYERPSCSVSKSLHGGNEGTDHWLSIGKYATVKAHCNDTGGSGCATADFHHDYNYDIDTSRAGAKGDNNGGSVFDKADNEKACPANQLVRVDHTAPKCIVSKSTNKDEVNGWLNAVGFKGTATVSASCSDPTVNGAVSGCKGTTSFSHTYKSEINTTAAGAKGKNSAGTMYDTAGNSTNCGYKTVRIDYTKPKCTVSRSVSRGTLSTDKWLGINEAFTVTAACADQGSVKSGCTSSSKSHVYSDKNINATNGGACGLGCRHVFNDTAGNSVTCAANQTIKLDVDKPMCRMTKWDTRDWHTGGVWGTFKCTDTGGSKLKSCVGHSVNTNSATFTNRGYQYSVDLFAQDRADNKSNLGSCYLGVAVRLRRRDCKAHTKCIPTTCRTYTKSCTCGKKVDNSCTSYSTTTTGTCKSACGNTGGCGYRQDSKWCSAWNYRTDPSCPCTSWGSWYTANSCSQGTTQDCKHEYKKA